MGNSYATSGVSPIDVILWIGEQILVLKKNRKKYNPPLLYISTWIPRKSHVAGFNDAKNNSCLCLKQGWSLALGNYKLAFASINVQ